jgi:hypothetical protein
MRFTNDNGIPNKQNRIDEGPQRLHACQAESLHDHRLGLVSTAASSLPVKPAMVSRHVTTTTNRKNKRVKSAPTSTLAVP